MATNASVNGNLMGGVWLITTITKEYEIKYRLFSKDWKPNIPQNSRDNNSTRLSGDNSEKNRAVVRRLDNNL